MILVVREMSDGMMVRIECNEMMMISVYSKHQRQEVASVLI